MDFSECSHIFLLFIVLFIVIAAEARAPTLVATFIIRDEAVNLRVNLPQWATVVDYFVFLVDSRTNDNSVQTIESVMKDFERPFVIEYYEFDGFGSARSQSLELAWMSFPVAGFVLIADPDWSPILSTISKEFLTGDVDVYRFTVFDRNGVTRRAMDWLLKHRKGLKMKYRLHEVLDIGQYTFKEIGWIAKEVEQSGSWHTTVGHVDSMSIARLNFDLALLHKDLEDFGDDPHVYYYLGVTYNAVAEKQYLQQGFLNKTATAHAVEFATLRLTANFTAEFMEERWATMYILGSIHTTLQVCSLEVIVILYVLIVSH
jgi:hypothetical protein